MVQEEYDKAYFEGENSNFYQGYDWHLGWITKAKNLKDCFTPRRVLVCGCAKGFLVKAFRGIGVEAWGMDISTYAISRSPIDVMKYVAWGDVCDMSEYDDNEFDLVTAIDLLEHIPEKLIEKAITELVRVSSKYIFTRQHLEWNKKARADKTHKTIHPAEWWIARFETHGVEVVDVPAGFMGRNDIPDEDWEDPEHEPFNPHEIIVFRKKTEELVKRKGVVHE